MLESILIPPSVIVGFVFMLVAGVLIGNMIWYRDRSEDEAQLNGLKSENDELQTALHEHKQAYSALEADLEDRQKDWNQLRAANKQLEQAHQTRDHDFAELNNEIARLQQLKDQAFHDLDQERQQRRSLQDALNQAEENASRVTHLMEQLKSQVGELYNERQELTQDAHGKELAAANAQIVSLREEREKTQREHQDELAEFRESFESMQKTLRSQTEDLESLRLERNELIEQLDDERQSREQIESKVADVAQLVLQRDNAIERAEQLQRELGEIGERLNSEQTSYSELQTAQVELKDLQTQNDATDEALKSMTQEYEAVSAMLSDERTRISKLEADNHRLSMEVAEATQQYTAAQTDVRARTQAHADEVEHLRTELEETAALLSRERHQREHLQNVVHERKATEDNFSRDRQSLQESLAQLKTQNDVLRKHSEDWMTLQGEHLSVKRMLSIAHDQIRQMNEATAMESSERDDLLTRIQELADQNSEQARALARLAADKAEVSEEIDRLELTHSAALKTQLQLETQLEELAEENRGIQGRLLEAQKTDHTHREQSERLEKVVSQRDEAMATNAEQQELIDELRSQVQGQSRALSSLNQQNDQLRQKTIEFDHLREEHSSLQSQLQETTKQLRDVATASKEENNVQAVLQSRIQALESRAKSNEETIRNLRRERAAVVTRSRHAFAGANPFGNRSLPEEESGGRMRRDEVLGLVYTQPPKRKDDLKKITGIAQVLEKKLNAFGVYTYRQIMDWDPVAVTEFSKLLSFRDRIDRDDWIGQARSLHFEQYGRAA